MLNSLPCSSFLACQTSIIKALSQTHMGWRGTCMPIQENVCLLLSKSNPIFCYISPIIVL